MFFNSIRHFLKTKSDNCIDESDNYVDEPPTTNPKTEHEVRDRTSITPPKENQHISQVNNSEQQLQRLPVPPLKPIRKTIVLKNLLRRKSSANDVLEAAKRKRQCALKELLSTEELYIKDLGEIVNGYIPETRNPESDIPLPEGLKGGKVRLVFGNIETIYEWHRETFLKALQLCIETPSELGPMIKRYERKIHNMYIVYCQNKPISEHIFCEHVKYFEEIQQKLLHRFDSVQRVTRYGLLLREITKNTEKANLEEELVTMKECCEVINAICRAVDDTMVVRRLQSFDGNIHAQGKLLLHGPLWCIEGVKKFDKNCSAVQRPKQLQVFLFEQSIIFANIVGRSSQFKSSSFVYRSHLQVNKMRLEKLPSNRFLLNSTDPLRPDLQNYVCYAATEDQSEEWVEKISNILQALNDFCKLIQSPIKYKNL